MLDNYHDRADLFTLASDHAVAIESPRLGRALDWPDLRRT
jgi:hypothetical protein